MQKMPPLPRPLQTLPHRLRILLQSKRGRIKLAAGTASILIVLVLFFGHRPAPEHVIVPTVIAPKSEIPDRGPSPPPNADNSKIILELFNPSPQAVANQLTQTSLSEQIEQTMTISFVLAKCQMISQDDYRDIFRALILYAEQSKLAPDQAKAEIAVRQIAESSKASYALVYGRTACNDAQLPALTTQILHWTRTTLNK